MGQTGLRVSTCLITRRGYDSAVAERLCSVRDEPTWARDRRFRASVGAETSFRQISSLRPGSGAPTPYWLGLRVSVTVYGRCPCHGCRASLCYGVATEPESLRQRRTALGISRAREEMSARQSPSLQVFVPIKRVSRADIASQCLAAIATIHANDTVSMYGSPHRYSRCENFLCLNGLSEVTQRVMDGGNQVRKPLWSHRVVPNVAADGGQLPICMAAGRPVQPRWASKSESLNQALHGRLRRGKRSIRVPPRLAVPR
jgi:hypothetical protein